MNEDILLRFLNKKADDNDLLEIDKWISESDENAKWLFGMEEIWSLKTEIKYSDKEQIEKAYHSFLERGNQTQKHQAERRIKPIYWTTATDLK